jgi:hypothetical protein
MRENWRLPNPPVFLLSLRSSLFDPFLPFLAVLTFFLDSLRLSPGTETHLKFSFLVFPIIYFYNDCCLFDVFK